MTCALIDSQMLAAGDKLATGFGFPTTDESDAPQLDFCRISQLDGDAIVPLSELLEGGNRGRIVQIREYNHQ